MRDRIEKFPWSGRWDSVCPDKVAPRQGAPCRHRQQDLHRHLHRQQPPDPHRAFKECLPRPRSKRQCLSCPPWHTWRPSPPSKEMCALMMVSNRSAKGISAWGFPESLLGQRRMAFCLWCLAGQPSGILEDRGSRPASTLLASSDCRGRSNQVLRWVSVGVESTDHRGDLCCGQVSRIVEQ